MVLAIRRTEEYLGHNKKIVTKSEKKNRDIARKSIVALKEIKKGENFTESNLTTKRPGKGISPMKWFKVLNKKARRKFLKDQLISL